MNLIRLFLLIILLFSVQLSASYKAYNSDLSPFVHTYKGSYVYEEDENKAYYAVILDDGSLWKIHSDHNKNIQEWEIDQKVHVEVRPYWYLYKRSHKFMLFNHHRNERFYAIFLDSATTVTGKGEPAASSSMNGVDMDYKLNITLNHPFEVFWEVDSRKRENRFSKDTTAYVSYNALDTGGSLDPNYVWGRFFIITGTGENAEWDWARRGHYRYSSY